MLNTIGMVAVAFFAATASGTPGRDQQRRRKPDQLGRERRQTIEASLGVSVFDRNIPADDKAPLLQSVQEPGPQRCFGLRGAAAEISNDRQARLRRGPKRRKRGRAADQREELAAFHYSMTSSARSNTVCGIVSPSAFAVSRLMTSSKRVDCTTGKSAGAAPFRMRPA